ncbi:MAG TPA: hypothetical protein PKZ27_03160 [Rhodocyclaceae bacterium]|nr:hypothetical protein [Rhodocyclaceae bacterium]
MSVNDYDDQYYNVKNLKASAAALRCKAFMFVCFGAAALAVGWAVL